MLFGQSELEARIAAKGNLADRVDGWVRLGRMDDAMASAILDFRLQRAGLTPGQQVFTADARELLIAGATGLPRRLTMVAHLAMEEAADRASTLVNEDHVLTAMAMRGIVVDRRPAVALVTDSLPNGSAPHRAERGFLRKLFARRSTE
jgi:hypothetical protein